MIFDFDTHIVCVLGYEYFFFSLCVGYFIEYANVGKDLFSIFTWWSN